MQSIVAGDWNMEEAVLKASGIMETAGMAYIQTECEVGGTCRTTGGFSNIDGCAVTERLARGVARCSPLEGGLYNPHRPIQMQFHPQLSKLRTFVHEKLTEIPK